MSTFFDDTMLCEYMDDILLIISTISSIILRRTLARVMPCSITKEALQSALDDENLGITFSNEDFATLQSPLAVLTQRDHLGSPAPERVREQIEFMQSRLVEDLEAIRQLLTNCEEAQTICKNYQA